MLKLLIIVLVVLVVVIPRMAAQDRVTGRSFATRSEVIATHGMAATSQPLATQVALDVLKQGGNAVDAAIAANAMLCLTEPTGSGLGGDLFALVWDAKTETLHGLNASGRSPRGLTLDRLRAVLAQKGLEKIPAHGPLPVSVPGCVDGWFELHEKFGRLPMKDVLAPTIAYGREGFPVTELIAYYWDRSVPRLKDQPGFADTFMPNGRAPRKGEIFKNPRLASTLEKIANEGRDVFYRGEIARTIDAFMKRVGGFITYDDMAAHTSTWVEPVSTTYRGYRVWELPPNGQGIAALQMLNILEAYDIAAMGPGSVEYLHRLVEAKKLAFEDRAKFYADPDFNTIPVASLISKDYAATRRALIDPKKSARRYDAGNPALRDGDTVYLTVADEAGNMVSLIQSNFRGMGCGLAPDGLGFIFQDRGELFALEDDHFNVYAPGKRPFHTIIPAFVTRDDQPWFSFGVMGGATQPQAHVQVLVNIIDFGMNVQEAGDAARIIHRGSSQPTGEIMTGGGEVLVESGISEETVRELIKMGHRVGRSVGPFGGYQGILRDAHGVYFGGSESRKDGHAAGF